MQLRIANQDDCAGIIALIDAVYREYDDGVNLDGAEADLLDLDTHYFSRGGAVWVLVDNLRVMGSHAAVPHPTKPDVCNFRRLYLDATLRGTDWGYRLMQITIDWAKEQGFHRVEFWSDTRFHRAHRFFHKFGFVPTDDVREMNDGLQPYSERFFFLDLIDKTTGLESTANG